MSDSYPPSPGKGPEARTILLTTLGFVSPLLVWGTCMSWQSPLPAFFAMLAVLVMFCFRMTRAFAIGALLACGVGLLVFFALCGGIFNR